MTLFSPEVFFTLVTVAGGGAIGAIIQAFVSRRKQAAETLHLEAQADSLVVNAALQISDRLQVQLAELEERTTVLATKNTEVREDLALVHVQNLKMAKQIAKLERENKSLKTAHKQLKEENEKLKAKLDECGQDSK